MDLTVLVITKNSEGTLRNTLGSTVPLGAQLLVIDDYSTDKTAWIARECGAGIISHHGENFGNQRAFALLQVKSKWTLILDSDEVLTENNCIEIINAIKSEIYDGYRLHFRNHLFGKKLFHGELHKKLVLFKTAKARIIPQEIHEQYKVDGNVGELKEEVLHYSYRSIQQVLSKFFLYSILQAKQYKRECKRYGMRELFLNPLHMFYARYINDKGYKDGVARIFLDLQFAWMEFLSYFFIPFVKVQQRVVVDCGGYSVGGQVQSGINRLIQGIYSHTLDTYDYYWLHFSSHNTHRLPKRLFSQLWLPLTTLFLRADIFLGVGGSIPWILHFFPVTKILFLYDFGFITSPKKYVGSASRLKKQTLSSIQIANKIVVLNEEIYKQCIILFPGYAHKVHVLVSGADHLLGIEEEPVTLESNKPFYLYVGVVKPVKRIDKIITAVGENYCVIAGPQEKEYKQSLKIGKNQHVQFIEQVSDGQLKWLYQNAEALIYTSEHEGFCYPVLEALTLGTPVIALDLPLFRIYKQYFSHLTLVENEKELRKVLELKVESQKSKVIQNEHPYVWKSFSEHLLALWQPRRLPMFGPDKKFGFIVILYKTSSEEKMRLEKEIRDLFSFQRSNVQTFKRPNEYEIYWIDNSTNGKGYAAGINEGIRKGMIDGCTDFIAMNPDISLSGITAQDIDETTNEFHVWGLAMKQNGKVYYGGEIDTWRLSGGLIEKKPLLKFVDVDFVSASIIGFSREVIEKIGLWDESYFMYYEDVDYCVKAHRAGFQLGINSDVLYDHFEVSQMNKKKERWIARSRWKFFWKYATINQKMRELLRLPKTILFQN